MGAGCITCGGDGVVDIDRSTPGRGHYTVIKPCPKCFGEPREQLELDLEERPTIDLLAAVRESIAREAPR